MTCETAMIENVFTIHPDQTVGEAMKIFEEKHIRGVPVVENDKLVGLFTMKHLLNGLLPKAASMEDGLQRLDFVIGTSPGVAKKLKKLRDQKIREIMNGNCVVVNPDTPTWELIRMMVKYGSPLPVVEEGTGKFAGLVSSQSLLAEMHRLLEEMEAGNLEDTE